LLLIINCFILYKLILIEMKNLLKHIAFGQSKAKVFLFGGQGTHEKGMLNSHVDQTEFIK